MSYQKNYSSHPNLDEWNCSGVGLKLKIKIQRRTRHCHCAHCPMPNYPRPRPPPLICVLQSANANVQSIRQRREVTHIHIRLAFPSQMQTFALILTLLSHSPPWRYLTVRADSRIHPQSNTKFAKMPSIGRQYKQHLREEVPIHQGSFSLPCLFFTWWRESVPPS
jgi:hypothetical protein